MRIFGLSLIAVLALSAQMAVPAGSAPVRTLVYQFGYNTKAASSGNGTGTTTVQILGPADDGGVMISGSDNWWNSARANATNTCDVHPDGGVHCSQRPYGISPMQLVIFPLLARDYFKGLNAAGTSKWSQTFDLKAAIVPGAAVAGTKYTWNCTFDLQGKGINPKDKTLVLVDANGKISQVGGRYHQATAKENIVWSTVAKIPIIAQALMTRLPQTSVYNQDSIELTLLKDSAASK